jgi:hypothetical protein
VQPVEDVDVEQQNQSRVICSESFVYQSDIILRRLVSQEMSVAKGIITRFLFFIIDTLLNEDIIFPSAIVF